MESLLGIWLLLWLVAVVYMAVYRFSHADPKEQPREKPIVPAPPPPRPAQITDARRSYDEELRLIATLDLDPDEREAASEHARQKLLRQTKEILD